MNLNRGLPAIDLAVELGDASLAPLLRPFLADSPSRTRVPVAQAIWQLTGNADGPVFFFEVITGALLLLRGARAPVRAEPASAA